MNPPGGLSCVRAAGALPAACALVRAGALPAQPTRRRSSFGARSACREARQCGDRAGRQHHGARLARQAGRRRPRATTRGISWCRSPAGTPFKVTVKKIGWQPSSTELIHAPGDRYARHGPRGPARGRRPSRRRGRCRRRRRRSISAATTRRSGSAGRSYGPRGGRGASERVHELREPDAVALGHRREDARRRSNDCYMNLRNGRCLTFVVDGRAGGDDVGGQSHRCVLRVRSCRPRSRPCSSATRRRGGRSSS